MKWNTRKLKSKSIKYENYWEYKCLETVETVTGNGEMIAKIKQCYVLIS